MGKESLPYSYSSTPLLYGTEDPSVVEESQILLSQFMRCPPRSNNAGPPRPTRGSRVPHEGSVVGSPSRRKSPPKPRQDSSRAEPLRDRLNLAQRRGELRRPGVTQTANEARVRVGERTVVLPQSSGNKKPHAPLKATRHMRHSSSNIKIDETSPSPSCRSSTTEESNVKAHDSSHADTPQTGRIRRSDRIKTGPTNYYQKIPLNLSDSEDEVREEMPTRSSSIKVPASQSHAYPSPHPTVDPTGAVSKSRPPSTLSNALRQRELGYNVSWRVRSSVASDFKVTKSWKGASNDVIVVAWSPDGTRFAAGATAQCDEHNMEYNRKNNLILGDLTKSHLYELPDHWIPRDSGRAAASRVLNDARLYMSVTAVQWFKDTLYTASYDNTVKLWNCANNQATCYKTLQHSSKVEVMARSNFDEDILATGTNSVGLWQVKDSAYIRLETRHRHRKENELVPTSLAWGINNATKNILLAGMSEKGDSGVPQNGLLAVWCIREASVVFEQFSPNSQNIFDIKWHPVLSTFATATSAGQSTSRDIKSVVSLYEPLRLKTRTMEFKCPALDMNEISFCPMNTDYVTASCTDGITYVWDKRNPGKILHGLRHGEPLNQLDETLPKEQADVGVRVAVWGDGADEFYTGASDGVLKRWDIFRAPDDVLVRDVAVFTEEIMCGAFSPDKSNFLIGDSAGGIHVLSPAPFVNGDNPNMNFGQCEEKETNGDPEPGVRAARELLSSGQLVRHPVYGPGQGPNYRGPFAAWARPKGTPHDLLGQTELQQELLLQQLSGPPPQNRRGISEKLRREVEVYIQLARTRNQQRTIKKRKKKAPRIKRVAFGKGEFIDLCSDESDDGDSGLEWPFPPRAHKSPRGRSLTTRVEAEVIDLTGETDAEYEDAEPDVGGANFMRGPIVGLVDDLSDDFWWPDPK